MAALRVLSPVRLLLVAFVGAGLLFTSTGSLLAQAQATTGVIRGTVTGPDGAPVNGAAIVMEQRETGFRAEVTSTGAGTFVRTLLPLGTYDVTAQVIGEFAERDGRGHHAASR